MYGGNGVTTFALPNLQSQMPIGYGQAQGGPSYTLGEAAGSELVNLLPTQIPMHNHFLMADSTTPGASNGGTPSGTAVLGNAAGLIDPSGTFTLQMYSNQSPNSSLAPQVIGFTGGSQAHENRMPYLVLNFCIALSGIFPSCTSSATACSSSPLTRVLSTKRFSPRLLLIPIGFPSEPSTCSPPPSPLGLMAL